MFCFGKFFPRVKYFNRITKENINFVAPLKKKKLLSKALSRYIVYKPKI